MTNGQLTDDEKARLAGYIGWHALSDEHLCNGIALGLRHAPTREARAMLLRQMREEYSHHTFMAGRVNHYGFELPEELPEGSKRAADKMLQFAERDWLTFLVGFEVTMDGIYGYPWSKAAMTATLRDEKYYRFYDTVLFPQEIGHYDFAQRTLHQMVADDESKLDQILDVAREAFPIFIEFMETAVPVLDAVGAETDTMIEHIYEIRNTYWPKEFGVALYEDEATPDSDVKYGPGM